MIYVPDTHAVVWFIDRDPRLSAAAKTALANAGVTLVIPTMVLVEIGHLYARGRIRVSPAVVEQKVLTAANCKVHPLDEEVVSKIPTSLDIHDSVIVATALVYRDILGQQVMLVTKDTKITQSGLIQTLW